MLRRIALGVLLAIIAATQVARAEESGASAAVASGPQRAFAELVVDGVDRGQVVVWIDGNDVLVPRDDAARAGIPTPPSSVRTLDSGTYVSLKALAPDVTFVFEATDFALRVSVNPLLLGAEHLDVGATHEPVPSQVRPPSAFSNYLISAGSQGGASAFLETGLSAHNSLLYSTESLASGGGFKRGVSYFAHDDQARVRRLQIGDVTVSGDALLGEVDVLGVGVQRVFDIDPYLYRFPTPSVSGVIASPGTADVYVNGLLVRSVPLQPGSFDLNQIPAASGLNDVTVVVRDASGGARSYQQSYLSTDALLRKGLSDYGYGAGFLRHSESGNDYGNPALAASYRIGVSNAATLGARFAATAQGHEIEGASDLRLGPSVLHVAEALSGSAGVSGVATDVALAFTAPRSAFSAGLTDRTPSYRALSVSTIPVATPRLDVRLSASQRVGRSSTISFSHLRQTFAGAPAQATDTLQLSGSLGRKAQIGAEVARTRTGQLAPQTSLSVSLTTPLGNRAAATVTESGGAPSGPGFEYRLEPPSADEGFGYDARYDAAGTTSEQLALTGHTSVADLSAYLQSVAGGSASLTFSVAGSVVALDRHVIWSRPVGDAFALVESGEVGGVPVFVDGRPVGRTNTGGLLLVPALGAYASNRIALDVSRLPLGVDLARGEKFVAPGYRGGSVASFAVGRVSYYVGTVSVLSAAIATIPADGTLTLQGNGAEARSSLDETGGYYFENLKPGRYRATVQLGTQQCAFDFDVPRASGVANALGARTCRR